MLIPFDITFRKGETVLTWVRYAESLQEAKRQAEKALEREYNGQAVLIRVVSYDKTWEVQSLEKGHNDYTDWETFCIRDSLSNCHVATVGAMDRRDCTRYKEFAYLMAAAPQMHRALELCYTRLFNYQVGMDEIRDPQATKELNAEALDAAREALDAARVPREKDPLAVAWVASLVDACKEAGAM